MTMTSLKILLISILIPTLIACGGAPIQKTATGFSQATQIVLIADELIGATVRVGSKTITVTEEALSPYRMGVLGSADKKIENMEILHLPVQPGDVELLIRKNGNTLLRQTLYLSEGQTREITL
jgi:hypothetical protein